MHTEHSTGMHAVHSTGMHAVHSTGMHAVHSTGMHTVHITGMHTVHITGMHTVYPIFTTVTVAVLATITDYTEVSLNFIARFLLNNQPDAPIIQIYSVIKLYMFRASSLPTIRSFLLYIRHW
jgi:hypothetical protein